MFTCLKSACWCKLVGRYKRHYVRMTSNISFWNSPASFSQFEKELYGVNRAYRCLHFPKICTNGLIFGEGGFFHLVLSEYANQINNFTNLIFLLRHTSWPFTREDCEDTLRFYRSPYSAIADFQLTRRSSPLKLTNAYISWERCAKKGILSQK